MSALPSRIAKADPRRLDLLLALAIGLLLVFETLAARDIDSGHAVRTIVASALMVVPVALRRRRPAAALVAAAALAATQAALGGELDRTGGVGVLIALATLAYSAGAWSTLRAALAALVTGTALFSVFVAETEASATSAIGPTVFVLVAPWAIGRLVRERGRRARSFRELAAQTEREQTERDRAAVAHERLRIGAELQDIVAHSVSAMVIHAAGARRLLRSDPDRARASILAVEDAGRQTLADMRHLLGVLKREEDPRALSPQPGLSQLPDLLAARSEDGLACDLQTEGQRADLTPGVDLVGYRAVETALACAVTGAATSATVRVGYERDGLRLEVDADCSAERASEQLRDIRERVALYGGAFELAPAARLRIEAWLPGAAVLLG